MKKLSYTTDGETRRECAASVSFHTVRFAHVLLCRLVNSLVDCLSAVSFCFSPLTA
ncbi:MAG: hypothetical protein FWF87_02880 [Synergistaceae bacterium]|nr:hypothetical protein [Synergistaceae bacterium]